MPTPFPKKRTLWPMLAVPLLMGTLYLLIAYPRFCDDLIFIPQHLFVLAFWILTTGIVMFSMRDLLLSRGIHFLFLPMVLVPTLSCFLLYLVYSISIIGNVYWGATPGFEQILPFVPHLFDLMGNFKVPPAFLVALLFLPFAALILIFMGRSRDMLIWYWAMKETFHTLKPGNQRLLLWFGFLSWAVIAVFFGTADPTIGGLANFSQDPVVSFFKTKPALFTMTKERVFWAQRDRQVEQTIRRRIPKVHNLFLFVVDALRADHLPLYGYPRPLTPFLTDLFPKAHFRKVDMALSTGLETVTGTICLLNSKEPISMSHLNYSLTDYLSDQGYKTHLILAGAHQWQLSHGAFGKKIDFLTDGSLSPGPRGVCDDELVVNQVANLRPDDGGFHFFYIHLVSVHSLGTIEDKYRKYTPTRSIIIDNTPFLGKSAGAVLNQYDNRILQMDSMMRKIMESLKRKGYLRDYQAVLTADHGQILGEKGKYGHGHFADIGGLRVPMVFFGSAPLPPFPESHFAVQLDVAPTLTDLAGLDFPSSWQGQSLLRKRLNPWSYHLSPFSHVGQEGAVVFYESGRILKYTRTLENYETNPGTLFNLSKDPNENENLVRDFDKNFLGEMRARAHEHLKPY